MFSEIINIIKKYGTKITKIESDDFKYVRMRKILKKKINPNRRI